MTRAFYFFLTFVLFYHIAGHTHSDKPMVLLLSFDGFRWDYLLKHNLTNFNSIKKNGTHAEYMINSFSTVTFPNHWTLVTGLYEESHGIIQNIMYDPVLNKTFNLGMPETYTKEWFGQNKLTEPIWATNQKAGNGRYSAAEWLGSNLEFSGQNITTAKNPINFGAIYFDEPDHYGHLYGPDSKEIAEKLQELDGDLGYLLDQLKSHHLFDKVNLIITSDHGMDSISEKTVIFLEDYIDDNLYDAYGSRACYSIFVKDATNIELVYQKFKAIKNIDVYKKDEIPESLRYKYNVRIGDMILVSHLGYAMYLKKIPIDWTLTNGDHGYYNNETSMFPIFLAHGPAFKKSYKSRVFNNVDLYPLMCFILGVQPAYNNGTLENVIDMLVFKVANQNIQQNFIFVLLLLIPAVLVGMTGMFVCFTIKNSPKGTVMTEYGYDTISNCEDGEIEGVNNDQSRLIA
ncbi:unnamed protein product [Brachionus calyciflorus]|uniref:Uncharacterized protein n=1 Tax=Brachionus calyciflorus TaxID=104777 RepID=A0A813NPG3_9BILA|nr:unnamed protein product [Brachionus calyciflorus]